MRARRPPPGRARDNIIIARYANCAMRIAGPGETMGAAGLLRAAAALAATCGPYALAATPLKPHVLFVLVDGGLLYVPGLQSSQLALFLSPDLPAGHQVHVDAPETLVMLPSAHGRHGAKPPGPKNPWRQEHCTLPTLEFDLEGQGWHWGMSKSNLYVPCEQSVHPR